MKQIAKALSTLEAIFREIFDESSYSRFLKRQHLSVSRESYAEFLCEQAQDISHRPRCC